MNIKTAFGNIVRRLRKEKGISQEILALDAELDRSYMSNLETGVYQPTISTLFSIAKVLKIQPAELVSLLSEELKK